MNEMRDEFLSEEDLDLRNMTDFAPLNQRVIARSNSDEAISEIASLRSQ